MWWKSGQNSWKSAKSAEIWAKSVKTLAKPLKLWANSLQIPQKWRPTCFGLKKVAPNVCRITWKLFSFQNRLNSHKKCSKFFRASLRKFGQKSFAPPNICVLLHLWPIWPVHYTRSRFILVVSCNGDIAVHSSLFLVCRGRLRSLRADSCSSYLRTNHIASNLQTFRLLQVTVVGVLLHVTVERRNLGRWCNAGRRCRRRQIVWGAKHFRRNFPKLTRKNFGPHFVRTFSQAGLLLGWSPKKGLHVILPTLGAIFAQIFRNFAKVFIDFTQDYTDFARNLKKFTRIFNISKLLGLRLHPCLLHSDAAIQSLLIAVSNIVIYCVKETRGKVQQCFNKFENPLLMWDCERDHCTRVNRLIKGCEINLAWW